LDSKEKKERGETVIYSYGGLPEKGSRECSNTVPICGERGAPTGLVAREGKKENPAKKRRRERKMVYT